MSLSLRSPRQPAQHAAQEAVACRAHERIDRLAADGVDTPATPPSLRSSKRRSRRRHGTPSAPCGTSPMSVTRPKATAASESRTGMQRRSASGGAGRLGKRLVAVGHVLRSCVLSSQAAAAIRRRRPAARTRARTAPELASRDRRLVGVRDQRARQDRRDLRRVRHAAQHRLGLAQPPRPRMRPQQQVGDARLPARARSGMSPVPSR